MDNKYTYEFIPVQLDSGFYMIVERDGEVHRVNEYRTRRKVVKDFKYLTRREELKELYRQATKSR